MKRSSRIEHFMAKDLFRASGLPHLEADDHEVVKDLHKVKSGEQLSPVLLVRGPVLLVRATPLWVADGYHRICASYHLDEDEVIPCRIVERIITTR